MRPNLITRLKEEWNNLDPVDPLRGLIADAIDALVEAQPSKPWVGLTDVAIWNTYKNLWMFHAAEEPRLAGDILKFARAIEAKLREKNA